MSTLTKIAIVVLVVLILLACPVFITQSRLAPTYEDAYKRLEQRAGILEQEVRHGQLSVQVLSRERDRLAGDLTKETGAMQGEIERLKRELTDERRKAAELAKNLELMNTELSKLRLDFEANSKRTAALSQQRDDAFDKIQKLNDEFRKTTDKLKKTQLDMDRQGGIIRALEEQRVQRDERIKHLEQLLGSAAGPGAAAPTAPTAPAAPRTDIRISGTVTAVRGDLASVNVGSAKGVRPGMMLVIYRGADYVAKLRVDNVDVGESAGVIIDPRLDPMQGDKVADRLD